MYSKMVGLVEVNHLGKQFLASRPRGLTGRTRVWTCQNGSWPNQAGVVQPNYGIKGHKLRLKKWQFIWFR